MFDKIASAYDTSEVSAENPVQGMSAEMYADKINRKYPIHTKVACITSMAEYEMDEDGMSDEYRSVVAGNLLKAASFYGIKKMLDKKASTDKTITVSDEEGNSMTLRIADTDAGFAKAASQLLMDTRQSAPYTLCKAAAKALCNELYNGEHSVSESVADDLLRLAGVAIGNKQAALNELNKRACKLSGHPTTMSKALVSVYGTYRNMDDAAAESPDVLSKIAALCDTFDEQIGDKDRYGVSMDPPEKSIFGVTVKGVTKQASDVCHIKSIDALVSSEDLVKHASDVRHFFAEAGVPFSSADNSALLAKVASLTPEIATDLLDYLEDCE